MAASRLFSASSEIRLRSEDADASLGRHARCFAQLSDVGEDRRETAAIALGLQFAGDHRSGMAAGIPTFQDVRLEWVEHARLDRARLAFRKAGCLDVVSHRITMQSDLIGNRALAPALGMQCPDLRVARAPLIASVGLCRTLRRRSLCVRGGGRLNAVTACFPVGCRVSR